MSTIREPAAAGRFYPSDRRECERMLSAYEFAKPHRPAIGAIVPHAGWIYSGATAALGIGAVAAGSPATVVVFGAVHVRDRNRASLYGVGRWRTPLGDVEIDEELAARVRKVRDIVEDPDAHRSEHSIEVELPLIQCVLPNAKLLPIMVRPGPWAAEIGRIVAQEAGGLGRSAVFLASTDLTHYGPAFAFEPHGRGEAGIRWAKDVNDRRFIEIVGALDAESIVPEAAEHQNACGAGAVAATIAAVREFGGDRYCEVRHITSADVDIGDPSERMNSVGYEAGFFHRD